MKITRLDILTADAGKPYVFVRLHTDEGISGIGEPSCIGKENAVIGAVRDLEPFLIGADPFDRELLYQKLHQGTRWLYRAPGWFGAFDNCLWDLAGKVAGLPVYALLGRVRERAPAYYNIGGSSIDAAQDDARAAIEQGFSGVKDHFYHAANENIGWLRAIREAVGPEIVLMHDCVGIYSFDEAVKVGKALEEFDYLWFEEPLPERQQNILIKLCERLDIPVLATEMFMYDTDMCAQWLISGATDMIRGNARHGTTQVMKLAHLAEMHGTTIELNGIGGLWGLVHAHLLCAIQNTSFYEHFPGSRNAEAGRSIGVQNAITPERGYVSPPEGPGWGAEWDLDQLQKRTVAVW